MTIPQITKEQQEAQFCILLLASTLLICFGPYTEDLCLAICMIGAGLFGIILAFVERRNYPQKIALIVQ
jgi:hypothetical protein